MSDKPAAENPTSAETQPAIVAVAPVMSQNQPAGSGREAVLPWQYRFVIPGTAAVDVPPMLAMDLHRHYQREMDTYRRYAVPEPSFADWLIDALRDRVYGRGVDAGAAADWTERSVSRG